MKSRTCQDVQGHFSNFSRTTEQEIQGHFHEKWLKSNNIKKIPGSELIVKKADILKQGPHKVLSYIFSDFVPNLYYFPPIDHRFPNNDSQNDSRQSSY